MSYITSFKIGVLSFTLLGLGACSGYGGELHGSHAAYGQAGYGQGYGQSYDQWDGAQARSCPIKDFFTGGGTKSRYGFNTEEYGCYQGGYWVYPQQQYVVEPPILQHRIVEEPAPIPAPAPVHTPLPPVTLPETCPEGQYRTYQGHCATVSIEEPAPSYAPLSSYPAPAELPEISYAPIRK